MKKLILTIVLSSIGYLSYGQGTITFQNSNPGQQITNVLTQNKAIGGTTFSVALYFLPDQANTPSTIDFNLNRVVLGTTNLAGSAATLSGVFLGGTRSAPIAGGTPGWFQVRAWEAAYGSTFEEALVGLPQNGRLALVGTSNPVKITLGGAGTPPGPAANMAALQPFVVAPVPEPSLIALGMLGIGAVVLLRRRSK